MSSFDKDLEPQIRNAITTLCRLQRLGVGLSPECILNSLLRVISLTKMYCMSSYVVFGSHGMYQ